MERRRATNSDQLSIRRYIDVLWRNRWIIAILVLVSFGTAVLYTKNQEPTYRSTASVLVRPMELGRGEAELAPPNMATEIQLAQSRAVISAAADTIDATFDEMTPGLEVSNQPDTEILTFGYTSGSRGEAQRGAQAAADAYLEMRSAQAVESLESSRQALEAQAADVRARLRSLETKVLAAADTPAELRLLLPKVDSLTGQLSTLRQQLRDLNSPDLMVGGHLVEIATPPVADIPSPTRNGIVAAFVALMLGAGISFLRDHLDQRIDGPRELEDLIRAPVLASIPPIPIWRKRTSANSIPAATPGSPAAEPIGAIRAGIMYAAPRRGFQTLMITSADQGEGKTSTAANLAWSLAHAGKNVTVVSADMRKPRLHEFFRAKSSPGLSEVLRGKCDLEKAVLSPPGAPPGLRFLASGSPAPNSAELLGSGAMGSVLDRLAQASDLVLIDSPPLLPVSDALAMVPHVDAILFVADARTTKQGAVQRARQWFDQLESDVVGAVLNNYQPTASSAYGYMSPYEHEVEAPARAGNGHLFALRGVKRDGSR